MGTARHTLYQVIGVVGEEDSAWLGPVLLTTPI